MMSKRFGRNQRRKLRATNDALSTALSAEKFFRARADERHARELEKAKDELGQTLAQVDQSFADKMRSIVRVRLSSVGDFLGYAFNTDRHQNLSPRDIDGIAEMIANEMAEFTRSA